MGGVVSKTAKFVRSIFGVKPDIPAPMPVIKDKSPKELREEAQRELGIDSVHSYNFAFVGNSGTGKSSLINALRGLRDNDPLAAKVDEKECTAEIKKYPHPEAKHVALWDIPGGSTVKNPAESYFMDKKLYAFDMIIITVAGRFTKLDLAIAEEASKLSTPIIVFVRSKSDVDINNRSMRDVISKREAKLKYWEEALKDIHSQLPENLKDRKMFVISAHVLRGTSFEGFNPEDYQLDEDNLLCYVAEVAGSRRKLSGNTDSFGKGLHMKRTSQMEEMKKRLRDKDQEMMQKLKDKDKEIQFLKQKVQELQFNRTGAEKMENVDKELEMREKLAEKDQEIQFLKRKVQELQNTNQAGASSFDNCWSTENPTNSPSKGKFQVALEQLAVMGFSDESANIIALDAASGNIETALDILCQ